MILIGTEGETTQVPDTWDFHKVLADASEDFEIPPTDPEDMALLHFTSGTTGTPKGAVHVHDAVVAHLLYALAVSVGPHRSRRAITGNRGLSVAWPWVSACRRSWLWCLGCAEYSTLLG